MADRDPAVRLASPFDHGVFLLHYNKGREAFHEGRYAEARRELENAQRMRPDHSDVLNLLGLVYFKTNSFPEAEVIYRRLASDNPNVFIVHSNLGLILFKQGKLDEAEDFLQRSVELRPNYAKSHLYLGLLYRQRKRYQQALEHLRFAGAERLIREVEGEMRPQPDSSTVTTQRVAPITLPQTGTAQTPVAASTKLQEAIDQQVLEGASKTFALHENGFLEINFARSVHVKKGTVSSYSGNLKFQAETGLVGTTAQTLVKATGQGKIFVFEKGRKTFLLDLNQEFIYVEGGNLLALEDTLTYRVEPIYDSSYQRKIDTVKIFGKGALAMSTSIEPLTLRVTRDYPLSISSSALVAWTGNLIPTVVDDQSMENVMIESGAAGGFQIRFEGDGVVISEQ
jgi:uncharacterized protein (AIM24 family)